LSIIDLTICLFIGLMGGVLGGMLGIGGSLVMIPSMALLFGSRFGPESQHLYQAAAMMVNLVVAMTAVRTHWKAGAVRRDALRSMIPAALVFILIGVIVGNFFDGRLLSQVFALFLTYVIFVNGRKFVHEIRHTNQRSDQPNGETSDDVSAKVTVPRGTFIGSCMGFMAGLLGIGGGGIAVPLQQVIFHAPLRHCIGTSTFVICITAGIGAIAKNVTLGSHGGDFSLSDSFQLAAILAPGALVGSLIGARLTHLLPIHYVRACFIILLILAGTKMSGLGG